jgi:hypothetical protein
MALFKRGRIWWYEFLFARRRVRESAKTTSKTVAKLAEQNRRRELEQGFNGVEDRRDERIKTVNELGVAYLEDYRLRHNRWNQFLRRSGFAPPINAAHAAFTGLFCIRRLYLSTAKPRANDIASITH